MAEEEVWKLGMRSVGRAGMSAASCSTDLHQVCHKECTWLACTCKWQAAHSMLSELPEAGSTPGWALKGLPQAHLPGSAQQVLSFTSVSSDLGWSSCMQCAGSLLYNAACMPRSELWLGSLVQVHSHAIKTKQIWPAMGLTRRRPGLVMHGKPCKMSKRTQGRGLP